MIFFYKHYQEILKKNAIKGSSVINCSFEFFPPKNIFLAKKFWSSVNLLSKLKPNFFSVTYGANNGVTQNTYDIVQKIYKRTGIISTPHLTCVNTSICELQKLAEKYWNSGIKSIVALRGDVHSPGYHHKMYALDLVILLKKIADFDISVAAYPEVHPEAKSAKVDIINLKKKVDAGANRAITQFFFNVDSYLRFRDECVKNGINIEIIPGILPISNFSQLLNFLALTNVQLPKSIINLFNNLSKDLDSQRIIGSIIAMEIVQKLYKEGVKNFHFYTLNHSKVIYAICRMIGI